MHEEDIENLVKLIEVLREAAEQQKHITERQERDNAIKMHNQKGDIYY